MARKKGRVKHPEFSEKLNLGAPMPIGEAYQDNGSPKLDRKSKKGRS